jgi:7-cyano-7-deazaguanine tRNA-ribosyltransferase
MEVVAGLTLKNLRPRVWDPLSPDHVPGLTAVMFSFDEFRHRPSLLRQATTTGFTSVLFGEGAGVTAAPRVFLDNGAFACLRRGDEPAMDQYTQFVAATRPAWYPVPADFIPLPSYSRRRQRRLFDRTLAVLEANSSDGFCPVVHPGPWLDLYMEVLHRLGQTKQLAIGGLVPHLLNSEGAQRRQTILMLRRIRREFPGHIHAFGIGGIVTLHLAAALGLDSLDSSGWRQRAARGLINLRGRGERQAVKLGNWKGREVTPAEWEELARCRCPACRRSGNDGLRRKGIEGFVARATHNLAMLLHEAELIRRHLSAGDFARWSPKRIGSNRLADLVRVALDEANP